MTSGPSASQRMRAIQAPIVTVIGDLIRECPGTISLGQGVVAYGPPPESRAALARFFEDSDNNKYHSVRGIPPLCEALSAKLEAENGIPPDARRKLVVTAGGNMAFVNAVLSVAEPGDEIILQVPYYFNHEMAVKMVGCRPVCVATGSRYELLPESIAAAITPRTRAVVTVSPNNPSGAVYDEPSLVQVNELCRAHGLFHIHDEAYEYFTYESVRHFSPGSLPDGAAHTISLFSLSKAYGFASWRVGYMVVPASLLESVKKAQDTIVICPPVVSQFAALGALEAGADYCRSHLEGIRKVRQIVLSELEPAARWCRVPACEGAFYLLLDIDSPLDSLSLAERLIREHGVATIPGVAFGLGGCKLRVAYGALEPETAAEGIRRLVRGLSSLLR